MIEGFPPHGQRHTRNGGSRGIQLATDGSMTKQSSSNSAFFKSGGREAAARQELAHDRDQPLNAQPAHASPQAKDGQPNFIPGEAPVGQSGRRASAKKK